MATPKVYNDGCNYGITDTDKSLLATIWSGLTAAIAAYNTGQAIYFADKQYDMAKTYLKISQWWDDYKKTYFDPVEDQEINEAMALKEEPLFFNTQAGRAQTAGRIRFKNAVNKAVQCTSEYCTGLRGQLLRDQLAQEATALTALAALGYRNERAFGETRSEVRWKRMLQTAARGREMQATAVSHSQLAMGIYGDLGGQAGKSAVGAASLAGYLWNRNDTIYPTTMLYTNNPQTMTPNPAVQTTSGGIADPNSNDPIRAAGTNVMG